jgi:streptomycin 6-kinase
MFDRYLKRWNLTRDGIPIVTHSSDLLPVRQDGRPAMLKIAREAEERRGASLMTWWDGDGAARVLAHDGEAVLLERATGPRSLTAWHVPARMTKPAASCATWRRDCMRPATARCPT